MKIKLYLSILTLLAGGGSLAAATSLGTTFSYSGHLIEDANPASGTYDFQFRLFDAETNGNQTASTVQCNALTVSSGLFNARLDFGAVFDGTARWLEVSVRTNGSGAFTTLLPRQAVLPAPYALYAPNAGQLNGLSAAAFAPATGSPAYVARSGDTMTGALRLPANGLRVGSQQLVLSGGNVGIGTLSPVSALDVNGTVTGTAFVGGGAGLTGLDATAMATGVLADARLSSNVAMLNGSPKFAGSVTAGDDLIGDRLNVGMNHTLTGLYASIAGGRSNTNRDASSTIAGGGWNSILGDASGSFIAAGEMNRINSSAPYCAIGGGRYNVVHSDTWESVIGGGSMNTIGSSASQSVIAGGEENVIQRDTQCAVVVGGLRNAIRTNASYSVIAGGWDNEVKENAQNAVVGGGDSNVIQADADYATIPGGQYNAAGGRYALAAGYRAKANHQGSFVWGDSTAADFASSGNNQFLIRASGGVGIGKNNPATALDVNGTITAAAFSGLGAALTGLNGAAITAGSIATAALADQAITSAKIAAGAVTGTHIADGTITSIDIADGTIASIDIRDGTIATVDLADHSVTSAKIVDGTITSADIADGTIALVDIKDGAVATLKLADQAVTSAKLANGAVGAAHLGNGIVGTANLADNAVTAAKLASDAGSLSKVTAGNAVVSGGNVGIGTSAPAVKLHVNGEALIQDGIKTGQGTAGYGMRYGATYANSSQTILTFSRGSVWWDSVNKQVILTNSHGSTYVHYTGHKREDMAGNFAFVSGYIVPKTAGTLATLNNNGEHLVVDIAGRYSGEGFIHLYCFYDNGVLVCNYYYRCQ